MSQGKNGFDFLLAILGLHAQIDTWNDYRKQQDDFFKFKPSSQNYLKFHSGLTQEITCFRQKLAERIERELTLQPLFPLSETLPVLTENLTIHFKEVQSLATELDEIDLKHQEQEEAREILNHRFEENTQAQELLAKKKEQTQQDQFILNGIIHIIEDIESLKTHIKSLEESTERSLNDTTLYQEISEIKRVLNTLIETVKRIETAVAQSTKA
ncbi:MAG: hypothetical protein ACRCXC_09555 [Legionella sp.]